MEIGDALVTIADKLGITVQQVYQLFVSVQTGKGIMEIVQIILFIIGSSIILKLLWARYKPTDDDNATFWVCALISEVVFFIIIAEVGDATLLILYPEYYGAKELIESLLKFK